MCWSWQSLRAAGRLLELIHQHDVEAGVALPEAFQRRICWSVPERQRLLASWELDDHQAVRLPVPFAHLKLSATHQVATAELRD